LKAHIILYVHDQNKSREFYKAVLHREPVLDVPGMTEFKLSNYLTIGLMPNKGIKKLLGNKIKNPDEFLEASKAELYLYVNNPQAEFDNACKAGATGLSNAEKRDWGHVVAYCRDFDNHIVAFAKKIKGEF